MLFKTLFPILALTLSVSAWDITFYTAGTSDCGASGSQFGYADHTGSGTDPSPCYQAGDAVPGCTWFYNGGWNNGPCETPMTPSPGSYVIHDGSCCTVGADSSCNAGGFSGTQDQCQAQIFEVAGGGDLWFSCWDC